MKKTSYRLQVIIQSLLFCLIAAQGVFLYISLRWLKETGPFFDKFQTIITIGTMLSILLLSVLILLTRYYYKNGQKKEIDFIREVGEGKRLIPENIIFEKRSDSDKMSGVLKRFFSELRRFILQIKNTGMQSQEIGEHLLKQTDGIVRQTATIAENTEAVRSKIEDLDREVLESEDAVQKMNEYIGNVNEQIEDQSSAVNESSASVEELIASIRNIAQIAEAKGLQAQNLATAAKENEKEMKNTQVVIEKVADSASVVLEMVDVLNDIVDQTDLLAMNAAIEAAHAGTYGHGFAVVAGEIRKLAENARNQSRNMSDNLKQVVENVQSLNTSSSDLERSNGKMIQEIREVAGGMQEMKQGTEEMSAGSDQISSALGNLVASSGKLQLASQGMRERLEIVEHSISVLKDLSRLNTESAETIGETIQNITRATSVLDKLGQMNEKNVGNLNHYVSKFKVRGNILAENLPPYNYLKNGEPDGLAVDLIRALFSKLGRSAEIEFMRWEDAQSIAAGVPKTLLLTVFRMEEREKLFHWIGPAFQELVQLFSLKERHIEFIKDIRSRQELVIGTQKGNIETKYFLERGFEEGKTLITFQDTSQLIQGLFSGKVDAIPLGKLQVVHQLQLMQRNPDEVERIFDLQEMATDLYMVLSHKTEPEIVEAYRKAFRELKQSKEYTEILSRWSGQ